MSSTAMTDEMGPSQIDEEEQAQCLKRERSRDNDYCDVCQEKEAKYTCPGCLRRTCSLLCVNKHKQQYSCSGKRQRTGFVSLQDMDDRTLRSDFVFLEESLRQCQNAKRTSSCQTNKRLPARLHRLVQEAAAKGRGTRLKIMPEAAKRRKENTTSFHKRKKIIFWRIQWYFPLVDIVLSEDRVHEGDSVGEHLRDLIDRVTTGSNHRISSRHKLRQFRKDPNLNVLLKLENRAANDVLYVSFDSSKSFRENLSGRLVIEYPTLIVVMKDDKSTFENYKIQPRLGLNDTCNHREGTKERGEGFDEQNEKLV